ncbi:rod-binding protein [Breoghania sp.]|uniref:rod-binding protein n=1 Tax=Breoghania sp. TaxID=2065378 RepID=UPI002AAAD3FE|nr:rod-binding protein [Breoghania sp.]
MMTRDTASLFAGVPASGLHSMPLPAARRGDAAIDASGAGKAAKEFESAFLQQMLTSMFDTIEGGGTFGDGASSDIWRGMLTEQYAGAITDAGGIGIAATVQRELLALQESSL